MQKIIVVSKTHLDLGFTDFAENIRRKYIDAFIPSAVSLAAKANENGKKAFVWTTGSWILKEALRDGSPEQQANLRAAIKRGDVAPHAMPFTTHTELLDEDTLDYGLSIVEELDKLRGRKTIAAKLTDVPGHTKGLVRLLARHGVRLLHIGVNGASALPNVPPCFLWKDGDAEVIVIYSGDYGGAFQSDLVEEILYFDHTMDNRGTPTAARIQRKLRQLQKEYPGYTAEAGTLDDYAALLWEKRAHLPVVEAEIGDTWIHGNAADPYKSAALRELMRLKQAWLQDGTMQRDSAEYRAFTDALLCVAEHTCGMDMKRYFADYEHYLKPDFEAARKADKVQMHHPLRDFPQNFLTAAARLQGSYEPGSYSTMEKSWDEQRGYIRKAVSSLSEEHRSVAEQALAQLCPETPEKIVGEDAFQEVACGAWKFRLNENGGVGFLSFEKDIVIRENTEPVMEYRSYSEADYRYWLTHYSRNLKQTAVWAVGDFARPLLKYVRGKYPTGRFPYRLKAAARTKTTDECVRIAVELACEERLCRELGAPRVVQIVYTLQKTGLQMEVSWYQKDANRLTEAIFLHLFPGSDALTLLKLGERISPDSVVENGGRNLHAVEGLLLKTDGGTYRFDNRHAPLLSVGRGKILEFDNRLEDAQKDGITYVLQDNVWGTNFPLWYSDNARFSFSVTEGPATAAFV